MEITKEKFNIIIGQRIMHYRSKMNLTREQLAALAGISPKYLYEIEVGRKGCSLYIAHKLKKYLDVDLECLLREQMTDKEKDDIEQIYQQLQRSQKERVDKIMEMIYEIVLNS